MSNVINLLDFKDKKRQLEARKDHNDSVLIDYKIKTPVELDLAEKMSKVKHSIERMNQILKELKEKKP